MTTSIFSYLDPWTHYPSSITLFSKEYQDAFTYIINDLKVRTVLEIGFYYGASAAFMLNLRDDVTVVSIDPGIYDCTHEAYPLVKERYPDRFQLILDDSKNLLKHSLNHQFDFCFIDGDHNPAPVLRDIKSCVSLNIPYILFDGIHEEITIENYHPLTNVKGTDAANHNGVSIAIKQMQDKGFLEPIKFWKIPELDSKIGLYKTIVSK